MENSFGDNALPGSGLESITFGRRGFGGKLTPLEPEPNPGNPQTDEARLGQIALRVLSKAAELDPTHLTQAVYEDRINDLVSTYDLSEEEAIRLVNHNYVKKIERSSITPR